jgi:isopenicillin N synthase-like dioxygenase
MPTVDVAAWRSGTAGDRLAIADDLDRTMRETGFVLVVGHGIAPDLATAVRASAGRFFALPEDRKNAYRTAVGGRGWIPPGAEANSYASGVPSPPDLKETYTVGHPAADSSRGTNVWPREVPDLEPIVGEYLSAVWVLALDLFELFAAALGLAPETLAQHASAGESSLNINRYPARRETGPPEPGQSRIGAHSDFGVLTILDRQVGHGGLQVQTPTGEWIDAPHIAGALAVNIGDMLAHWTGGRWRATVHRVLPPSERDPDEELMSLVAFCGVAPTTRLETLVAGGEPRPAILAGDYMQAKLAAITIG